MNRFHLFPLLAVFLLWCCEDYGQLKKIQHLPATLKEVSGIEKYQDSDVIWMINDSGNKNILYGLEPGNTTLKSIEITNAENKDWEDLARDTSGNLYIGDFGNNRNKRKNLVIYKIENPNNITSEETTATKILFDLEDQKEYPPKRKNRNFDIEAFVHFNENLYLFTKNRSSKSTGISKIYKLPEKEGEYTAELVGEFQSCEEKHCCITGAAVSPDQKQLALLTNKSVHLISDFKDDNFTSGKVTHREFGHDSQKESIVFKNDSTIYVADEQRPGSGRNLYEFSLN